METWKLNGSDFYSSPVQPQGRQNRGGEGWRGGGEGVSEAKFCFLYKLGSLNRVHGKTNKFCSKILKIYLNWKKRLLQFAICKTVIEKINLYKFSLTVDNKLFDSKIKHGMKIKQTKAKYWYQKLLVSLTYLNP